jgi:hypothetical protein
VKICYIAKHVQANNDDEGSITHALRSLGHEVTCVQEHPYKSYRPLARQGRVGCEYERTKGHDFALIHHHWSDVDDKDYAARRVAQASCPIVFWWFDLVDHPQMPGRWVSHIKWLSSVTSTGFCTDGCVKEFGLHVLRQGADARIAGRHPPARDRVPILFAGMCRPAGQPGRWQQIQMLQQVYGQQFVLKHSPQAGWVYREKFARLIAHTDIVLAPMDPTKPNYWSNRVYVVSGFGGFLLHPYCEDLTTEYVDGEEIVMYHDQEDLMAKIDYYLPRPEERRRISENALRRTLAEHTYTHRCRELIRVVEEEVLCR